MDVIYPNDRIVLENGTEQALRSELSFDSVVREGEHMSSRMIDTETGKEAVYYFVPVEKGGETVAVLAGVLESSVLVRKFHPAIYGGNASYCIVDSKDGNYIMDAWHFCKADLPEKTIILCRNIRSRAVASLFLMEYPSDTEAFAGHK